MLFSPFPTVRILSLIVSNLVISVAFAAPLRVVATTPQIAEAVRLIGGNEVEVKTLVAPGLDPHTYKATPSDVEALKMADVIFISGLHLEAQMERVLKAQGARKAVVIVSDGIPRSELLPDPEIKGQFDPHFWHDISLWRKAVDTVKTTLIKTRKADSKTFEANAMAYDKTLSELDADLGREIARIPRSSRVLVTTHDAFSYFARRYGFQVDNVQGVNTESEASVADVRRVSDFLVSRNVSAMFLESSTPSRYAQAVIEAAAAKGKKVSLASDLYADGPGEASGPAGTYERMMRLNTKTIVSALSGITASK
jgi:manganese/zinc/iron transport system substrate-binding protein